MLNKIAIILIPIIIIFIFIPYTKPLTKVEQELANIDLDTKWVPGYNVACNSGNILPDKSTTVKSSHCSCLVASICKKLGVEIPSVPKYSQYHLADNQLKWLNTLESGKYGWYKITEPVPECYVNANKKAQEGKLVIAGIYEDEKTNGHISIVRPTDRLEYFLKRDGPIVVASSIPNTYASTLVDEFKLNNKDFQHLNGRVMFFYNDIN